MIRTFLFFWLFAIAPLLNAQDASPLYTLHGEAGPGQLMIVKSSVAKAVYLNDILLKKDSSGYFVFGFDRDDTGTFTLKIIVNDSVSVTEQLVLGKRTYNVQKINKIDNKYVSPPPEVLKKIEEESARMSAARKKIDTTGSAYFASGFVRPVEGGRISGVFGGQRIYNGVPKSPHNGLDIALPKGTPVFAMADGIVSIKGDDFYYNGNFVLLDHGKGLSSVYLHFDKVFVQTGQFVKKGDKIGEIGSTGRSTGAHLHWGVQWYKKRIDPDCIPTLVF